MPIEFDITLESKDMYRFNMYQMYTSFHGIFSIVIAIALFAAAIGTYGSVTLSYTALYAIFGVLFLIYMPVTLWMRSKHSLAASEVLRATLHYALDEEGIHVSQGEESALLPWKQIYKMISTKSNVLIYTSRTVAYVIPRSQMGDKYPEVADLAKSKLEKYRVKMK